MDKQHAFKVERTALIDGDYFAYQAAARAASYQSDQLEMLDAMVPTLMDAATRAFCDKIIVALSCSREDGFRRKVYPLYKTQRVTDPPPFLSAAKQALREGFKTVEMTGLEADDILGILATGGKLSTPVIIGVDKDLLQIPGWHFNPEKQDFPDRVTHFEAYYRFVSQWLTGDSSDGFGGIKGCGPKRAEKILAGCRTEREMIDRAAEAYEAAGVSEDVMLQMARCARILQIEDWDFQAKKPVLWEAGIYPQTAKADTE